MSSPSQPEAYLQELLTRQFTLEDIRYDISELYRAAGLPATPRIVVCGSYQRQKIAIQRYAGEGIRDEAWVSGCGATRRIFDYVRLHRLGSSVYVENDVVREARRLRAEIGLTSVTNYVALEQGFGLSFEEEFCEASEWGSFLAKGIWNICFFHDACFVCRCPTKIIWDASHRLHSTTEAALQWAKGESRYFIHGILFPKLLWEELALKKMKPKEIFEIENTEQRAVAILLYGYEDLLKDAMLSVLDEEVKNGVNYALLQVDLRDDHEKLAHLLKVECPSTGRQYLLRVSPRVKKVRTALAWTFPGVRASEYEQMMAES